MVHINDLVDPHTMKHLLKYDSVHGKLPHEVEVTDNLMKVGGQNISLSARRSPTELPWEEKKVDLVLECTGIFKTRDDMKMHMSAGAPKVLISAPGKDEDLTVVYGVNHDQIKPEHKVVSNGSCTTNCLAPPTKVIHEAFGITSGLVTTVHSYTSPLRPKNSSSSGCQYDSHFNRCS